MELLEDAGLVCRVKNCNASVPVDEAHVPPIPWMKEEEDKSYLLAADVPKYVTCAKCTKRLIRLGVPRMYPFQGSIIEVRERERKREEERAQAEAERALSLELEELAFSYGAPRRENRPDVFRAGSVRAELERAGMVRSGDFHSHGAIAQVPTPPPAPKPTPPAPEPVPPTMVEEPVAVAPASNRPDKAARKALRKQAKASLACGVNGTLVN